MLIRVVLILLGVYVAFAVFARVIAARALYHPEIASGRLPPCGDKIRGTKGDDVAILHLPDSRARFTIWFFHGNAEDLGDVEPWLREVHRAGFSVFAFDYPGYGLSGGRPSEAGLYAAARSARDYLRNRLGVSAAQTLIFGRSLGGGPALQMATEERVGGVILQSTFTSVYRVVTRRRMLPFDFFENERKIGRVRCPVLVMHGGRDEVIPFSHGHALFAAAVEPKRFLPVPDAAHNDFLAVAGQRFWDELRGFSELCARELDGRR